MPIDESPYMAEALVLAERAASAGEVPVGAVVVNPDGMIVGRAHNQTEADNDPSAHAEIVALRQAAATLGSPRLPGCDLYVTLEPCPMCAQAISFARIRNLYFGASDPKGGGVENGARVYAQSSCHHAPEVFGGINEQRAGALLRQFFSSKR